MNHRIFRRPLLFVTLLVAPLAVLLSAPASAADEEAAMAILKKQKCLKCHAIEKTKKGPSYKKLAAKYAGKKAEGEDKMWKNLTTNPTVKLEDGTEEEHKALKGKVKDEEIRNIIAWILSLK
jgi:cytochrome c